MQPHRLSIAGARSFAVVLALLLSVGQHGLASGPPSRVACIRALIDGDQLLGPMSASERATLHQFYEPENYLPLWVDPADRPTFSALQALRLLGHAAEEGLDVADYRPDLAASLMRRIESDSAQPADFARFDVLLSASVLRYVRHLHQGRVDPRTLGVRMSVPEDSHPFAALVRSAIAEERLLQLAASLRPRLAQYEMLRRMLAQYQTLANAPTLDTIPQLTRTIRPGEPYDATDVLSGQLAAFGDLSADGANPPTAGRYEGALVAAVKQFQSRHGLDADGVLGEKTVDALRVPLTWRVRQIELALERLRWVPDLEAERLIVLNIPMFRLWAWDAIPPDGAPLFGMDAIVGRALNTETPVFVADMRTIIFRPYWNVPTSILRHEVLPAIAHDPGYLSREDMEIVRGTGADTRSVEFTPENLTQLRKGMLRVRQRPGPKNALGLIKFVFPNEDDVYMHGTPAQSLFARNRRDFSHGCVRVADPVALAAWVLQDRPEWTRDRILSATAGTRTIEVKLSRPIQVVLFYTTAAVMPEDGTIRFADDIYRHDAKLDRALRTHTPAH